MDTIREANQKRLDKAIKLKNALQQIQKQVKIIEDNDIFFGDLYENFMDYDKEIQIAQRLLNDCVTPKVRELEDAVNE